jgi:gluconolactonase
MSNPFEIYDDRFKQLLLPESRLEKLADGCIWAEGPVEMADGSIVWSDIPNNRMLRWSERDGVSTFRQPSNHTNGNYRDLQGRLLSCEHGGRRVSRTEPDGTIVTVVDKYHGLRLNSPNDIVVKSDGTLWFTDPPYGILAGSKEGGASPHELPGNFVYRFDPETSILTTVATDFVMPNGLAFSPDEQRLYIADTSRSHDPNGNHHVRVFDVVDGKTLRNGRLFVEIEPGMADGFRFDHNGYLYISSQDSIQVYTEARERLGKILVPEPIANCVFGGPEKNRLFITASTSLYAITLNTRGVQKP